MIDIIGFVGFIGSGKGTAGDILTENGYIKESFAKGVKDTCATMFGWPRHLLEGDTEESRQFRETPDSYWSSKFNREFIPREALQKMGTEVGRDVFHNDFWIIQTQRRIEENEHTKYVITDVRFPNEIEWIHKMGGKVYEVHRGEQPSWYKMLKVTKPKDTNMRNFLMIDNDVHYSEWAWIGCEMDGMIDNNGTLEDLTTRVKCVIL